MSGASRRRRAPPPHFTTTRTGVQIGRCYVAKRPAWSFTRSEDWLQDLLLQKHLPARDRRLGLLLAIVMGVALPLVVVYGGR